MKYPSPEVAFYVDKLPSRLALNIVVISEPVLLVKLLERIYRAVGPTLATSHEHLFNV